MRTSPTDTPAYFRCKNYSPESWRYLAQWHNFTKNNLDLQWLLGETVQLDKTAHLRKALESKKSQVEQNSVPPFSSAEASKGLQGSKIASSKDLLQDANEKLKIQQVKQRW